jgi:hypothetical protein
MVRGIAAKTDWWKGRDSNPRPRHYELAAPLKISFIFNNLSTDAPLRLARRSTTEHDRFPQISRILLARFKSCARGGASLGGRHMLYAYRI